MRQTTYLTCVAILAMTGIAPSASATPQALNTLRLDGETYAIVDVNGSLPTPETYDITPAGYTTAVRRGYYFGYALVGDRLEIDSLFVNSHTDAYPAINGVRATRDCTEHDNVRHCGPGTYSGVGLPIAFSGQLRVATDFIQECRDHRTYNEPQLYRVVKDLTFRNGVLTNVIDRSEEAAAIQRRFRRPDECRRYLPVEMTPLTYANNYGPTDPRH